MRGNATNVLVDTMGPWDRLKLLDTLASLHITPQDVHYVVCTHSHPDHIGNLNAFTFSQHVVGTHVYKEDMYHLTAFEDSDCLQLSKDIRVVKTAGHTLSDVSVVVDNVDQFGTVVVAGDLFECETDLSDDSIWKDAGSEDQQLQRKNRQFVLSFADYVIPGHGSMFAVKR